MKIVVGIPARMGSSRFPGKPLCDILGSPMIEHVYKRCLLAKSVDEVFVATCDKEIEEKVKEFNGKSIMTKKNISRPGLRVAEACKKLKLNNEDIVVIAQGDEPLVYPDMIDVAVEPLIKDNTVFCVNLAREATENEWKDTNEIKVVTDLQNNAIYMSRSPIPSNTRGKIKERLKQVCVMPFKKKNLVEFQNLNPTPLEIVESIEMLRAIEHGYKVRIVKTNFLTKSVDTEKDRKDVEKLMKKDQIFNKYIKRK